jgi:hypothetical protein
MRSRRCRGKRFIKGITITYSKEQLWHSFGGTEESHENSA